MCWALRSFLRYLHHKGLNPLAGCVPSIRRWKLASLPTYLSAVQVQTVLDGCDRATALGRRDYAILMMLAKLGMRAGEVATLTLDDIDWRSGEMLDLAHESTASARQDRQDWRDDCPNASTLEMLSALQGCSTITPKYQLPYLG
jgi:integrase